MNPQPSAPETEIVANVVAGIAASLSVRAGDAEGQSEQRVRAATGTILGFQPSDTVEAMLAGHCVILHETMLESTAATMRGEAPSSHRDLVSMDRAFGANLARLARHRAAKARTAPREEAGETDIAERVTRHAAARPAQAAPAPMAGLNRQARRELERLARRQPIPAANPVSPNRNAAAARASATASG